ncbi:MAG: outer membrane lipoprotein carrier protein LolA [Chitinophagales bacterium]|nr:outer membrane lipoprotein carrier protein LolA [Chitinophagales bacterium]
MRNIAGIILLFSALTTAAQPAGFKKLDDVQSFNRSLSTSNKQLQDISSDFKQVKNMSLLAEKIQSKGKFYFKKDDKVRIEYTEPYNYLMVVNGTRMLVRDEQKTNKINTANSKMMQSVNRVMVDCMSGTVMSNPDFKVTVFESGKQYLLSMKPISTDMKTMFDKIDVYMNKAGLDVAKLVLTESGGDYTSMDFYNTKHNSSVNEALFKVK